MRKFLILFSLLLVSSCSLPWQKDDFSSVIQRHTEAQFDFLSQVEKALGLQFHGTDSGVFRGSVQIPEIMSAHIESDYTVRTAGRNSEFSFDTMKLEYGDVTNSGNLILDKLKLLVFGGEAFMQITSMTGSLSDQEIQPVLEKYKNQWIGLSDTATLLSGSTDEERLEYTFSQNLSTLTLEDLRGYSLRYPLWKLVREVPVEGKYSYDVELDKVALSSLIRDLGVRLTEKPLDAETEKSIASLIESISLTGSLSIAKDDPLYADFDGYLSTSSNPEAIHIYTSHTKDAYAFAIGTIGNTLKGNIGFDRNSQVFALGLVATASGEELGKLSSKVLLDGRRIKEVELSFSAEEVELSLDHKNNTDGTFVGNGVLPIGTIVWSGSMVDERLADFHLGGDALGGKVSMNLAGSGTKVAGPLSVTLDEESVLSADIIAEFDNKSGKYGLALDIASPEDPKVKTHISFDVTHTRKEDASITIEKPKAVVPYMVVSDEISALMPDEPVFTDTSLTGSEMLFEESGALIEEKDPR